MYRGIRLPATITGIAGILALGACAAIPPAGPTVMALPGAGKSFQQFQQEDFTCRGFAQQATGFQQPGQAATNAAVGSAVLGTAIGAAAGAVIGAAAGNPAAGAAIGGTIGALI
ncbi:MAG: glycine zipper family protein, partial [Acetobacteraceae bacterium]